MFTLEDIKKFSKRILKSDKIEDKVDVFHNELDHGTIYIFNNELMHDSSNKDFKNYIIGLPEKVEIIDFINIDLPLFAILISLVEQDAIEYLAPSHTDGNIIKPNKLDYRRVSKKYLSKYDFLWNIIPLGSHLSFNYLLDIDSVENLNKMSVVELNELISSKENTNKKQKSIIEHHKMMKNILQYNNETGLLKLKPMDNVLVEYLKIYSEHYSDIYSKCNKYFQTEIYLTDEEVGFIFKVLDKKPEQDVIWNNTALSGTKNKTFDEVKSHLKEFEVQCFYVIKPNEEKNFTLYNAYLDFYEFDNAILSAGSKV